MSAYDKVADLRAKGCTISAIAIETGLDRKTVRQPTATIALGVAANLLDGDFGPDAPNRK